jgi:large subunit ribosomal protein L28
MTRRCELTGKLPMTGNRRSHAENSTRRVFRPNLVNVTLMSDVLGRKVRVRASANGLKSVEHRGGLDAYLLKAHDDELSATLKKMKTEIKKARVAAAAVAAA